MTANVLRTVAVALMLLTAAGGVSAKPPAKTAPPASASVQLQSNETLLVEHGHYTNKSGQVVHSPAHTVTGAPPSGASAQCRDGTWSFSRSHRGTCSHHGGVAQWLN